MNIYIKADKHYGNLINFKMFYAENLHEAKAQMVASYGEAWSKDYVLLMVEAVKFED